MTRVVRTLGVAGAAVVALSGAFVLGGLQSRPGGGDRARDDGARAREVTSTSTLRYLIWLPEGYEDDPSAEWPVVLFLHGAGERGDNLDRVKAWGPPKMAAAGEDLGAIVVAPQCPAGEWWEPKPLLALLDQVVAEHRVDEDRVYLTGLSMGGFGTWALGSFAPERFAALVPVCGGTSGPLRLLDRLAGVPVWAFHGADDTVVPLSATVSAVERVRAAGGDVKVTVYEGVGHDSWRPAYADEEMWAWLMEQRRGE